MDYRREIDGLRALAVLPVMLFHAGFEAFGGGFVGVDVFFVISGYLITTIILVELEQGRFSLVRFYERRARRILPALFLVMIACIPFAWFWFLPGDMEDFSQSLVAVSVFASNILFWRESGYFDAAAELKPLLHSWSLAVEEQYYLLFPLFLLLFWRLGWRWMLATLALVFVVSLAVAQWGVRSQPAAAFFLLPARGWELLTGAFVAFYLARTDRGPVARGLSELGGWLGLALIVYAVFRYDELTPFPGLHALVPTLGAALVILFASAQTSAGRFVGNKVFVGIGLISYSAYLWHQPLFAFARYQRASEPGHGFFLLLSLLALALAYLSWRFVEAPFRNKQLISCPQVFAFAGTGTALLLAVGLIGYQHHGYSQRLPSNIAWESLGRKLEATGDICELKPVSGFKGIDACRFGSQAGSKTVILYGDSHAQAISQYLDAEFRRRDIRGVRVAIAGCHVVPGIVDARDGADSGKDCDRRFSALVAYIKSEKADVIVSSRWSFRLYPVQGHIEDMPYVNSEGGMEKDAEYREYAVNANGRLDFDKEAKEGALRGFVEGLLKSGQRVFLVYPVPEIGWNIAKKNWDEYRKRNSVLAEISIPYADFKARNEFVVDIFSSFSGRENFYPVKPSKVFCNSFVENRCVAQYRTVPYYYDDDHLSDAGAKLLVDDFLGALAGE